MGYEALVTNLRIKLYGENEQKPFYNRQFNMKEIVKKLNVKSSKLRSIHFNPIRFMQQHGCSHDDNDIENDNPSVLIGSYLRQCASYFSQFAQQDPGFEHVLTFVYTNRDFVWKSGKSQQIKMHITYNMLNGKQKSLQRYFIIRNRAKPFIKIPKEIGICSGQHRTVKAILEFPDPSFSDEESIQIEWSRVTEESQSSGEKIKPISTELVGEKLGTYLSEKICFFYSFIWA